MAFYVKQLDMSIIGIAIGYISPLSATSAPIRATFEQGTGNIVLDNLNCTGNEDTLFDCKHNGVNHHDCTHFEDAGAVCEGTRNVVQLFHY